MIANAQVFTTIQRQIIAAFNEDLGGSTEPANPEQAMSGANTAQIRRMITRSRSLAARLMRAKLALDNTAAVPEIASAMAAHGYDATVMGEGRQLLDQAQAAYEARKVAYGNQFRATDHLLTALEAALSSYRKHRALAKIAFKDNRDAQQALGVDRPMGARFAEKVADMKVFYENLLAATEWTDAMAGLGQAAEGLSAAQSAVVAIETANAEQEALKSLAQQATIDRNLAMKKLETWLRDFHKVARVAMADDRQMLEAIGLA